MIATIGPVWDGNEVWLLVAGGATFAAFPEWYATLFSRLLPAALPDPRRADRPGRRLRVPRQAPRRSPGGRAGTAAICIGSFVPALLWGVAFANIVAGRARSTPTTSSPATSSRSSTRTGCWAGSTTLGLFVTHGAVFLALKTDRRAARAGQPDRRRSPALPRPSGRRALPGLDAAARGDPPSLVASVLAAVGAASVRILATGSGARAGRSSGTARHDRPRRRRPVRCPLPERDAVVDGPGVQPDRATTRRRPTYTLTIMTVVAVIFVPARPALPGLDLLGLPPRGSLGSAGDRRARAAWPRPPAVAVTPADRRLLASGSRWRRSPLAARDRARRSWAAGLAVAQAVAAGALDLARRSSAAKGCRSWARRSRPSPRCWPRGPCRSWVAEIVAQRISGGREVGPPPAGSWREPWPWARAGRPRRGAGRSPRWRRAASTRSTRYFARYLPQLALAVIVPARRHRLPRDGRPASRR